MKRTMPLLIIFAAVFVIAALWLVSNSRAATETPAYKVIRTDGKFEIRDYPAMTIASTPMRDGGMNRGFGQLFRFITGSNQAKEKISMTSPVLVDAASDKRAISFIMPRATVEKGVPQPSGEDVSLGKVEAARFAVLRFRGGRTEKTEQLAIAALDEWLRAQKITPHGAPLFAYYDPPWTPIFMRRNEVMRRIEKRAD